MSLYEPPCLLAALLVACCGRASPLNHTAERYIVAVTCMGCMHSLLVLVYCCKA